jgi:hypothetical protein
MRELDRMDGVLGQRTHLCRLPPEILSSPLTLEKAANLNKSKVKTPQNSWPMISLQFDKIKKDNKSLA